MIRDAVDKGRDREAATADGYRQAQGCVIGAGSHWMNRDLADDPELDLLTPEVLMYDGSGELVGIEYFVYATARPARPQHGRPTHGARRAIGADLVASRVAVSRESGGRLLDDQRQRQLLAVNCQRAPWFVSAQGKAPPGWPGDQREVASVGPYGS